MRLLIDDHGLDFDEALGITRRTIAYTNHTLLPEALESWPLPMFERMLPRHMQIIYAINSRVLREARPDLLFVDFNLGKVGVDGDVHVEAGRHAIACVETDIANWIGVARRPGGSHVTDAGNHERLQPQIEAARANTAGDAAGY
jgi:hypothetical protein